MTVTTDNEIKIIIKHLHANFVRNYAIRKAIEDNYTNLLSNNLWHIISNSCLDIAVINWCSLFGSENDATHWKKCELRRITDIDTQLLNECEITKDNFVKLHTKITSYRNRAVAHIDLYNWHVEVPFMQQALKVINVSSDIFSNHNGYEDLDIEQEFNNQTILTRQLISSYIATSSN